MAINNILLKGTSTKKRTDYGGQIMEVLGDHLLSVNSRLVGALVRFAKLEEKAPG